MKGFSEEKLRTVLQSSDLPCICFVILLKWKQFYFTVYTRLNKSVLMFLFFLTPVQWTGFSLSWRRLRPAVRWWTVRRPHRPQQLPRAWMHHRLHRQKGGAHVSGQMVTPLLPLPAVHKTMLNVCGLNITNICNFRESRKQNFLSLLSEFLVL